MCAHKVQELLLWARDPCAVLRSATPLVSQQGRGPAVKTYCFIVILSAMYLVTYFPWTGCCASGMSKGVKAGDHAMLTVLAQAGQSAAAGCDSHPGGD